MPPHIYLCIVGYTVVERCQRSQIKQQWCELWPFQIRIHLNLKISITNVSWKCLHKLISVKMRYHIGVYTNYLWFHNCFLIEHHQNQYHKNQTYDITSTTPSCSGPIPAQKLRGNSVLGVVFSNKMHKMDFHYSHRFSWEKHTKLIYHMPWLYQYPPLPFHRSYKN